LDFKKWRYKDRQKFQDLIPGKHKEVIRRASGYTVGSSLVDYNFQVSSLEAFRKNVESIYQEDKLKQNGTLKTFLVYPNLENVKDLPIVPNKKERLKDFQISAPMKLEDNFFKADITVEDQKEVLYLDASNPELWQIHSVSDESPKNTLIYRFIGNSNPYLERARLKSLELMELVSALETKYAVRPKIDQIVAKQFFDTKSETVTYKKRTLMIFQEDCESTLKVLQDQMPIFPDSILMRVYKDSEHLYTTSIRRNGTTLLRSGPKARYFFDDIREFLVEPSAKRLDSFRKREPRKEGAGRYVSKPIEIKVGPNLNLALKPLKDRLLKKYICVIYHSGNPYLDIAVIDAPNASEYRVIGSGESIAVIPTKYDSPASLLTLTRMIMEAVGGEDETEYQQPRNSI
jgi:hypothetical protein